MDSSLPKALEIIIGELLRRCGLKLAVAESCTGGLLCDRITNVPGSSDYFIGGIVSYAYEAKVELLGVSWDTLKAFGAVSRETVLEMARGARRVLDTDIGISVSGIAGPGGGMPEKPVGLTWVGLAAPNGEWARVFIWEGDRLQNKAQSAEATLKLLLDYLQGFLNKT
ncbi:MAG: CinA family protein [Anaerolineales bacterium]|nr:CinA family protein [Anaerolineales bacterium]